MSVTAIARKAPDLPGRQSLKEAIAAANVARQEVVAIEDALDRAERLTWEGRAKVEAAQKSITAAKRDDAAALAESLVRGGAARPQAVRSAREEQLAATDALEAARSAVTRLENDLKEAEDAAKRAAGGVRAVISAMLAPVARRMAEEASTLRAKYLQRVYAIGAMADSGLDGITRLRFDISDAEDRALRASAQSWLDAIEVLKRDPDAELPSIEGN